MTKDMFAEITGFAPTYDEWMDILDKAKHCNSMEDYIQTFQNHNEARAYYEKRADTIEELQKEVECLRAELDIELNWVECHRYGTQLKLNQIQFINAIDERSRYVLDDASAAKYLADNFGYDISRLSFPHKVNRYQVNKYRQIRLRSTQRLKNVINDQIHYIRFDVFVGEEKDLKIPYELVNGDIHALNEVFAHSDSKRY